MQNGGSTTWCKKSKGNEIENEDGLFILYGITRKKYLEIQATLDMPGLMCCYPKSIQRKAFLDEVRAVVAECTDFHSRT